MERAENKLLRHIINAFFYVRNATIKKDQNLPSVVEEITKYSMSKKKEHVNTLAVIMLNFTNQRRRLERLHRLDLPFSVQYKFYNQHRLGFRGLLSTSAPKRWRELVFRRWIQWGYHVCRFPVLGVPRRWSASSTVINAASVRQRHWASMRLAMSRSFEGDRGLLLIRAKLSVAGRVKWSRCARPRRLL